MQSGWPPFFFVTMYFILLVMGGPRLLVNNNKPIRINELDSCCYSCWPSACHWVLAKHNLASIVVQQMVQCLLNWIFSMDPTLRSSSNNHYSWMDKVSTHYQQWLAGTIYRSHLLPCSAHPTSYMEALVGIVVDPPLLLRLSLWQ